LCVWDYPSIITRKTKHIFNDETKPKPPLTQSRISKSEENVCRDAHASYLYACVYIIAAKCKLELSKSLNNQNDRNTNTNWTNSSCLTWNTRLSGNLTSLVHFTYMHIQMPFIFFSLCYPNTYLLLFLF